MRDYIVYSRDYVVIARISCDSDVIALHMACGYIDCRMSQRFVQVVRQDDSGSSHLVGVCHYDGTISQA